MEIADIKNDLILFLLDKKQEIESHYDDQIPAGLIDDDPKWFNELNNKRLEANEYCDNILNIIENN